MKKALFLDRDGIINRDYGYVYEIEKFEFNKAIFDIVRYFQDKDYLVIVITNQSGIGRGYYSEDDFLRLSKYMLEEFKKRGLNINSIYYCPHSPEQKCNCRKPNTKMIESAKKDFNIDLKNSIMVGDKQSDINLAKNAGISTTIAIGDRDIKDSTYKFKTIDKFREFLLT
jgi:D-glycero-D-manno-heptose 1,7-bisphosphate phosphatase